MLFIFNGLGYGFKGMMLGGEKKTIKFGFGVLNDLNWMIVDNQ